MDDSNELYRLIGAHPDSFVLSRYVCNISVGLQVVHVYAPMLRYIQTRNLVHSRTPHVALVLG
ncbi:MAG: hypothetical protein ACKPKO_08030, partial [Candidatus Fonsibacter sp.]